MPGGTGTSRPLNASQRAAIKRMVLRRIAAQEGGAERGRKVLASPGAVADYRTMEVTRQETRRKAAAATANDSAPISYDTERERKRSKK